MLSPGAQYHQERKMVEIDPLDTSRILTQSEQGLIALDYETFGVHTIRKDVSIDMLEKALEKYYEWYPVVKMDTTEPINGMRHFKHGNVRPTTFAQDIKNNEVIRSKVDYYQLLTDSYRNFYCGKRYTFAPRLYKVDLSQGENDPVFGNDAGYIMIVPASHLTFDGKSHRTLSNFINGWMKDDKYKPNLSGPQIMPNSSFVLLRDGSKYAPVESLPIGKCDYIGKFEEAGSIIKSYGTNIDVRRIPKSQLRHPKGYTMTVTMSGIQAFMYTSLLLDYHKGLTSVGHIFGCPYAVDPKKFKKLMDGDTKDMVGNDITGTRTYQSVSRFSPKTLYEILDITKKSHGLAISQMEQAIINERYLDYTPEGILYQKSSIINRFSNFGDLKLKKGPVSSTMAWGIFPFDIGALNFVTVGQEDGSVLFLVVSLKSSFPQRVNKLYGDLYLRVCKIAEKRDITREELAGMPEYRQILELMKI